VKIMSLNNPPTAGIKTSKRIFDFVLSSVLLVVLLPVLVVVGLIIRANMGSPVIFRQERPGLGGKIFTMRKFRSMRDAKNKSGQILPDRDRLTGLGRFLRKTSLDELPALWNVLKGEMSLVGPRPLLVEYLPLYDAQQARRHEVPPGITGWAQVNGRNGLSWDRKFELDVWYVDNQSFWLDLKILALTVGKVLARDGISSDGHETMPVFKGTRKDP
jgi:lipopolysaccharide/colanic/teichoic acid biosynthesis glycosyltransferase